MSHQKDREFHFDKIFKEKDQYLEYVYKTYKQVYDLKNIHYEGKVSQELFKYVLKRNFFILLVIYDDNNKIFLERNIQDDLFWSLPGGSIKKNEEIHAAIRRISEKIPAGQEKISIGEIEPIAFITNDFKYKDESYSHYGFAFVARLRNKNKINIDDSIGSLVFPSEEEIKKINRFANKEVVKLAIKRIGEYSTPPPEEEVSINEKHNFRYMIHNKIMKKFFLTDRLKKKQDFIKILRSHAESAESLIDVSCGDSGLIRKIAPDKSKYIVANDVSWSQIKLINSNPDIIYTNHNAEYFPFKENSFDIVYCGNTLHHMESKNKLLNLFESMAKIGRKIIIVEIENPKESSVIPYLLNKYWYGFFLKDVGGSYFDKNDFQSVISSFFADNFSIKFLEFKNVQGNYLMAVLSKKNNFVAKNKVLEIEYKFRCKDIDKLTKKCSECGYEFLSRQKEKDEYYTDINGKFVKDRVCLRIRSTDSKSELTYKGKSTNLLGSYSKEESNIFFESEQKDSISDFLFSLGYLKYSVVSKDRCTLSKKFVDYDINITIDEIDNAGSFVEFELIADFRKNKGEREELEKVLKEEINKFKKTGLEEAILPYRDYVAKYVKERLIQSKKIKAIFFDFDGTVAPTEKVFFDVFRAAVKKVFNRDITLKEYKESELDKNDALFDMLKKGNLDESINKTKFMDMVYAKYSNDIGHLAGDQHLKSNLKIIKKLKAKGFKVAIVSTSKREFIEKILDLFGANDLFDVIVAREDVTRLKPDSGAYLLALKRLKLNSRDCFAVEDSNRGIQSAKGALINCLSVYDDVFSSEELSDVLDVVKFSSLSEICLPLLYS